MLCSVQNDWNGRSANSGNTGSEHFKNVCFRCILNLPTSCKKASEAILKE